MANQLFPTSIQPLLGADLPDLFQTVRSRPKVSSTIQTMRRWDTPKMRSGKLTFMVNATDLATLRSFWAEHYGSGTPFDFRYPWPDVWYGLYVGLGDGAEDVFDLPGYDTSVQTVYKNGASSSPSILTGTGDNSRDQCDFSTAPAANVVVTVDFTGYRQIVAVMSDQLRVTERGVATYQVTLSIDEV